MHINLESKSQYSIQAYSNTAVKIDEIIYQTSIIISPSELPLPWDIKNLKDLKEKDLKAFLKSTPEIIIFGCNLKGQFPPQTILSLLSEQRIGCETMSIGAACRTYNILENEGRKVVLGIIL